MRAAMYVLFLSVLSGCVAVPHDVKGPDGRVVETITIEGGYFESEMTFTKAGHSTPYRKIVCRNLNNQNGGAHCQDVPVGTQAAQR